ncbi:isoprenyl transferase [Meiothermus taiwanensis]|jgi:short-chain Z-isoprenyl diphosphate synthase|uniref:Isoprenyl transferase n=2 Tax=Meiothermus taiwanensis TaxID=172827 RepID=A0A399E5I2_9DEIN|nr:isoprenyl transferase [Meiothermus taiwanensis]AWR87450.1 undecaprenyl diphosphate synthase [Meiothermus taiwanensis WR-220]RIH78509.1 (2Z,6E)-farnesyl diphosphate synthase [Meiothermus taiwanensis]
MALTSPARISKRSLRKKLLELFSAALKPLYWWYEKRIEAEVRRGHIPRHLGLILDGNRRFARELGLEDHQGHEFGVQKAYEVLEWCLELKIPTVTIWVFSTDNFNRSQTEVETLMQLFVQEAKRMAHDPRIHANEVRVRVIGRHDRFPPKVLEALEELEKATEHHNGMLLNIAMGYGGREEIVDAVKSLLLEAAQTGKSPEELAAELDMKHISERLYTAGVPDPDFIIRTSGEIRLSGFLLWQAAYSEYYFFDAFWPAFRKVDFLRAVRDYQKRERRFGR